MKGRTTFAVVALLVVAAGAYLFQGGTIPVPPTPAATAPWAPRTSPSSPAIGVAARSSWYEFYTTNPKYPDDPADHRGGLDARLVALMDRAQTSLDVADYDFDLADVADAMARAKQRGAAVRIVTDTDTLTNTKNEQVQAAFKRLKDAGIPIVDDGRQAIMHDKFTVADGEWVSTGSWNYTDGDTYRLNNWMGIFASKDLAVNYAAEFTQMFDHRKFGPGKAKQATNTSLTIGGTPVTTCFAPKGNCADLIITTINREARQSIEFMAFSFTHDGIGKAIIDKHQAGASVVGVFETTGSQTQYSEYGRMKQAGLDVYTDGNPYVMHHKVIILDGRTVIAGSFNFSANADDDNDENLLIVEDRDLASAFRTEFARVLEQAKRK